MKLYNREQNLFKDAKEAEKVYLLNINSSNCKRDSFIENTKNILEEFQKMDVILVDVVKEKLERYMYFQDIFNKNINSESINSKSVIEKISSENDTKEFIEKNNTYCLPPYKFEFIPYTFDCSTKPFDQYPYSSKVIKEVKIFISNAFLSESPEIEVYLDFITFKPDHQEAKVFNEIQNIITIAWEGGTLQEEEKKLFDKNIVEKKFRKYFFACLNKYRISGLFILSERSFNIFGELLNKILNEVKLLFN